MYLLPVEMSSEMRWDVTSFIDPTEEITVLEQQRYNNVHMTSNTVHNNNNNKSNYNNNNNDLRVTVEDEALQWKWKQWKELKW